MSCNDTVMDGYYFWLGKFLAEMVVFGGVVAAIITVASVLFVFDRRRGKK